MKNPLHPSLHKDQIWIHTNGGGCHIFTFKTEEVAKQIIQSFQKATFDGQLQFFHDCNGYPQLVSYTRLKLETLPELRNPFTITSEPEE